MLKSFQIFLTSYFLLLTSFFYSQTNLVQNPSFETYTACPNAMGVEVNKAVGWDSCRASPDYFNICSTSSNVKTPRNYFGCQYPASGNAYCGFWTYTPSGLYREMIIGQLTNPLIVSQKYFISFKVSRADSIYVTGYSTNRLGVKFTKVKQGYTAINNTAHFFSNSVITDTIGWTRLFGTFLSDSVYNYIMIGNFFDDANTTKVNDFPGSGAYYYIDEICVSTDSLLTLNYATEIQEINIKNKEIIYPNPADKFINIIGQFNFLQVFNVYGKEIEIPNEKKGNKETILNSSFLSNGIYFLKTENSIHKIIINH